MVVAGTIDYILTGLGMNAEAVKCTTENFTLNDLTDLFLEHACDRDALRAEFTTLEEPKKFRKRDTLCLLHLASWYYENVQNANFDWTMFSRSVYIIFKKEMTVKAVSSTTTSTLAPPTTPTTSPTLDFTTDILA